ncbi:NfeD family protein [Vacuolonema iberomarrocanum]|uniref:NfeD family protein n=1 Tax=Vacuolonema iberomarrocanum TaxID=3454632 RepID=UPI0019EAE70C|nr:NfeD-like protein [filamentous cyanobacterium LEGE 07170]
METVYWLCFAVGGVFVFLAAVGGLDGADIADPDVDLGMEVEVDEEADLELVDPGDAAQRRRRVRPPRPRFPLLSLLASFKFWTFGSCFFGLTGLVLTWMGVSPLMVAIAAVSMGVFCGISIAWTLRSLRRRQVNSLVRTNDLAGLAGVVEIPLSLDSRGKVRLNVKGSMVDFIAYTNEERVLEAGDRVFVVGTEQNCLWVVAADTLESPNSASRKN